MVRLLYWLQFFYEFWGTSDHHWFIDAAKRSTLSSSFMSSEGYQIINHRYMVESWRSRGGGEWWYSIIPCTYGMIRTSVEKGGTFCSFATTTKPTGPWENENWTARSNFFSCTIDRICPIRNGKDGHSRPSQTLLSSDAFHHFFRTSSQHSHDYDPLLWEQ